MATKERFFDMEFTFVPPVPAAKDGKTALVIVDMQYQCVSYDHGWMLAIERLMPGSCDHYMERCESLVLPNILRLLEYFRESGLPVIFFQVGSDYRDYRDIPARWRAWIREMEEQSGVSDILWSGNEEAYAVRKEIAPLPDEIVIQKRTQGAFNSTHIDQLLRELGIENLIFTGVSTNACVETTARDAADRGYGCVLVDDAMADMDPEAQEAVLRGFYTNFGRLAADAQSVIDAIESGQAI